MRERTARFRGCALTASFLFAGFAFAGGGGPARKLDLSTLEGGDFHLESLAGKIVLLDFWAPWCVPCRASFPFLDGLQTKYGPRGFQVVALTLEENADSIFDFLDSVPARFPVVRDPTGRAGEVFDVVAMPTSFLLGRDGQILARFEGSGPKVDAQIEAGIAALVAGEPLPPGTGVRVARSAAASTRIKAWQRGYLADPIMSLDGDALDRMLREHIHASKEAAAGDGGPAGGGCGCN